MTQEQGERDRTTQQAMKLSMDITSGLRQNPSPKRVLVLMAYARDLLVKLDQLQ